MGKGNVQTEGIKPRVFINKIVFNDNTELLLESNSIVAFTGANNCGKSQVLKDIENSIDNFNLTKKIIIKESSCCYSGSILEEDYLKEHFIEDNQGLYQMIESANRFKEESLIDLWERHSFSSELSKTFVRRLDTETRLRSSNPLVRESYLSRYNPISKVYQNEKLAQQISEYFHQAFGLDLVVNRNDMTTIPLHVGVAPDKNAFTIANQDDYYRIVEQLPRLQDQGDGMRSFVSVLLNAFTTDYSITLIDEPEAFLHPPQARILGKMLANINLNQRQIFISTHSEDFLQGLLDADNVTVIRINRNKNINKMSILQNDKVKSLWGNPILKYSNILSGLFHDMVVVCESDYDCLFYQAILDSIYQKKKQNSPDILFVHCGGKQRIKDIVKALKAVDVPVVAITDFDLLNTSQELKPLVDAFGVDWKDLAVDMKCIYDHMNSKNSRGYDAWKQIKKIGKAGFTDNAPEAYERVEKKFCDAGLFIVPVGEMECFDKTINKEKKEWVYHVIENYDLLNEPKLESAREFIEKVMNYK